jgi:hypothetical protein
MVMEMKHMVDGDVLGTDGGEEDIKIPLPKVERKINPIPKIKIMVVV